MTKLIEWLTVIGALVAVWLNLITKRVEFDFAKEHETLILYMPLIVIVAFGLYAVTVILYRVFTFNDCEEAAIELKKEIKEATTDLKKLGFVFKDKR